jgi:hypothetical protein
MWMVINMATGAPGPPSSPFRCESEQEACLEAARLNASLGPFFPWVAIDEDGFINNISHQLEQG